jgi:hypothetical protein
VCAAGDGNSRQDEAIRDRAKCAACRVSFTLYEPGHYPHRQFQLDVVAHVVADVAIGAEPATKAAARRAASATSARRWTRWVAQLTLAASLLALAQRIDPDAPIGAGASALAPTGSPRSEAAAVLAALEQLGAALVRRGVALASRTGLGRVLEWQHRTHRDVVHLVAEPTRLSPAMALGPLGGGP